MVAERCLSLLPSLGDDANETRSEETTMRPFTTTDDTWVPSRWPQLPRLMAAVRTWLRHLPRDLADRIASGNAEALCRR